MNGYEALRESAAWIDLSARGKIILRGSASFGNELEVGSHYVGKQGPTSTPSPTPDSAILHTNWEA